MRAKSLSLLRGLSRRRVVTALLSVILTCAIWVASSIAGALAAPGTDPTSARLAEWAREHHGSAIVNELEKLQAQLNPPPTAGSATQGPTSAQKTCVLLPNAGATPQPVARLDASVPSSEGCFEVISQVDGSPMLATTTAHADSNHTDVAAVAWMSAKNLRFNLHPGFKEPGQMPWSTPDSIPSTARSGLQVAFNSAFRLADSHGGYYAEGRTIAPLRDGTASLVIDESGHVSIGSWGTELHMTPTTSVVRQNLVLLVDGGKITSDVLSSSSALWGKTAGNSTYVWRSGIGITKSNDIVYVAGPALSAYSLADVLRRTGAVRAMALDMNKSWTTFTYFQSHSGGQLLHPDMERGAGRYFTHSSRDFFTGYQRSGVVGVTQQTTGTVTASQKRGR